MFLKSIHIKNYNQFENLELDLTYPKGHAKAGEPLEKICIIGDNGTGKTTILELIKEYYNSVTNLKPIRALNLDSGVLVDANKRIIKKEDGEVAFYNTSNISGHDYFTSRGFKLLFFPTGPDLSKLHAQSSPQTGNTIRKGGVNTQTAFQGGISNTPTAFSNPPSPGVTTAYGGGKKSWQSKAYQTDKFIYDLSDGEVLLLWRDLRKQMNTSIIEELKHRDNFNTAIGELSETKIDKIHSDFKAYKRENPNGYDEFAAFLNPLLNKFHLELNPDINLRKFNEIEFIELKAKDGAVLSSEKWSTGIRQLIYTILPLYYIKSEKGLVIIDEAERSLYPNTQRNLIGIYKKACPNMQLIFATHSPILASSFEPWEVIELKFNEKGKVERKPYFKGENHVDNYHIRPMYLQWDSLFMKMFGLENDSNEVRNDMLMELAILKRDLKNSNGKDKKELQEKYEKLAEQLDWATL